MTEMNGLEITRVEFREYSSGALVAFASVVFNDVMKIDGFKVFKSKDDDGFYVKPPSVQKKYNGEDRWFDSIQFAEEWKENNPVLDAILSQYGGSKTENTNTEKGGKKKPW